MSYRNERFNRSMPSVEESAQGIDLSKWRVLSDKGAGVKRMIEAISERERRSVRGCVSPEGSGADADDSPTDDERRERLWEAEMRLADAGKSHLIRILLLIVANGSNREISLRKVPRRTYFLHRAQLLDFFGVQEAGEL